MCREAKKRQTFPQWRIFLPLLSLSLSLVMDFRTVYKQKGKPHTFSEPLCRTLPPIGEKLTHENTSGWLRGQALSAKLEKKVSNIALLAQELK